MKNSVKLHTTVQQRPRYRMSGELYKYWNDNFGKWRNA